MVFISAIILAARARLRGRYAVAVSALLIPTLARALCVLAELAALRYLHRFWEYITPSVLLLYIVISFPLSVGVKLFFITPTHSAATVFDCYDSAGRAANAAGCVLLQRLFVLAVGTVFVLLPCRLFSYLLTLDHAAALYGCGFLIAAGVFITMRAGFSAFLMPYTTAKYNLSPLRALLLSIKNTRRKKSSLLLLYLRLSPLLLSCMLVLPAFYVLPLLAQAKAVFALELI